MDLSDERRASGAAASQYQPGSKVVIRFNPHHAGAENIVGTVVAYRAGVGFGGCDWSKSATRARATAR